MDNYEKGEIARIILLSLLAAGAFTLVLAMPGLAHIYKLFGAKSSKERQRVKQSLNGLERRGVIKTRGGGDGMLIYLSKKGVKQAKLEDIAIEPQKTWDGVWRIIAFDIPEKKKRARRAFSNKLRDIGCFQLQKSVVITPYPCRDEVEFVADYFRVRKYIQYIKAVGIENEDRVKREFGLKK